MPGAAVAPPVPPPDGNGAAVPAPSPAADGNDGAPTPAPADSNDGNGATEPAPSSAPAAPAAPAETDDEAGDGAPVSYVVNANAINAVLSLLRGWGLLRFGFVLGF